MPDKSWSIAGRFPLLAAGLVLLIACGDSVTQPQVEADVTSTTNRFRLVTEEFTNATKLFEFTEEFTGDLVDVIQACDIQAGSAVIVIRDSLQRELFRAQVHEHGHFMAQKGMPGMWQITVELSSCTGRLDITVVQAGLK